MQQSLKLKPILSVLIIVIGVFAMMAVIGRVLVPFIAALLLAYVYNPLVDLLERKLKIKRQFSAFIFAILTLMIFIIIPLYIIPVLIEQFKNVIYRIPEMIPIINQNILAKINAQFGSNISIDLDNLRQILFTSQKEILNNLNVVSKIAANGLIIVELIIYIILIPFALFYSILNWHKIIKLFDDMIPRSFVTKTHQIVHDIDQMLSAYLRGQLSVMFIMAAYYAIGLNIVGLPSATAIGIITGLLVFVPYLGILSGLLFALLMELAQFSSTGHLIAILAVFGIGHILEGGLVTPFLVGGRIGLNPVMIILALFVFGKLFGLVGVFLALPLSAIALVIIRHLRNYYKESNYYKDPT